MDNGYWFNNGVKIITNAEKYACHYENILRAEFYIPLRQYI